MAANPQTEPEFTTVASQAPAPKKSHAGFLVLLLLLIGRSGRRDRL